MSGLVLLAQALDLAGEVPVVLAGGVADGRGLAAALAMGAAGVAMGTRFLASTEMGVHQDWKRRIVEADAVDAVKVPHDDLFMPPYTRPGSPPHQPRALRTPLTVALTERPDTVDGPAVGARFLAAIARGRGDEYLAFAGRTVGLIHDVRPAAEIVHDVLMEATAALTATASLVGSTAEGLVPVGERVSR